MSDDAPFRLVTPDGRWVIQLTEEEEGQFHLTLTLDGNHVVESLTTDDSDKVIARARRYMDDALKRTTPSVGGGSNEQP